MLRTVTAMGNLSSSRDDPGPPNWYLPGKGTNVRRRRFCPNLPDSRSPAVLTPLPQVSLPDSVIETSRPVKLKDFAEHYRIMSADSDFR